MKTKDYRVNKVELLVNGIIYVERNGQLTSSSLTMIFGQVGELAARLRDEGQPVLILNHAHDTNAQVGDRILTYLEHFDFDRIAVYGTPKRVNNMRDLMLRANGLEQKVCSFQTKEEALVWLHAFEC